jgi:hypothetical protein
LRIPGGVADPGDGDAGFGGAGFGGAAIGDPETVFNPQFDPDLGGLPTPGGRNRPGGNNPFGGGGVPGMPGGRGGAMIDGRNGTPGLPPQDTPIKQFRLTLVREKGVTAGLIPVDISRSIPDDDGWHLFSVPLARFSSTADASGPVRRVILSGDAADDFFVAELALVSESNEMTASIRQASDPVGTQIGQITVKPGPVNLVADVESGTSDTIIEWNYDADNVGSLPPPAISGGTPIGGGLEGMGMDGPGGLGMPGGMPGGIPGMPGGARTGARPPAPGGDDNFDEAPEPAVEMAPRVDALGSIAKPNFPNEEQNYRVEITVRDRAGRKAPVKASILVQVRG